MATLMATTMMTTGKDGDNNGRGWVQQQARTVTTTGKDDDEGKEDNSKDNGNNGKGKRQGW
jgi:hypothetical protein